MLDCPAGAAAGAGEGELGRVNHPGGAVQQRSKALLDEVGGGKPGPFVRNQDVLRLFVGNGF
ncbi:MAG TPA: hypothetical protein VH643_28425 [Gemmataceae bacterium]